MKKYFNLFIMFVFAILVIPNIVSAKEKITRINVHIANGTSEAVYGETITNPTIVIDSVEPAAAKDYLEFRNYTAWHLLTPNDVQLENGAVFGEGRYELWIHIGLNDEGLELYEFDTDTAAIYLDENQMSGNARNTDYIINDIIFNLESPAGTAPSITSNTALGTINKGDEIYETLTVTGTTPITWSVKEGSSLPEGLSLSESGVLSGAPTVSGEFSFVIVATNEAGSDEKTFTMSITNKEVITRINVKINSGTTKPKIGQAVTQPEVEIVSTVPEGAKDYIKLNDSTGWHLYPSSDPLENGTVFAEGTYTLWVSVDLTTEGATLYKLKSSSSIYLDDTKMKSNASGDAYLLNELKTTLPEKHIVTLNSNGGPAVNPIEVNDDSLLPAYLLPPDEEMIKEGYTFLHWCKDEALTERFEFEEERITSDMTLYAKWESNTRYTVTLDPNNGINEISTLPNFKENEEWVIEEPSVYEYSAPAGYEFAGWKIEDTIYNAKDVYKVTKDVTAIAQWREIPPVLVIDTKEIKQTGSATNSVSFKWNKVSAAKGYYVQVKSGSKWKTVKTITKNSTVTTKITKLTAGKKYIYRVQAYNNKKKVINTTNNLTAYTKPGKVKLSVASNTYNSIKLSYKKVTGASKYEVFRSNSKTGKYTKVGETKDLTYKDKKLTTGKTYYYKVRACNKYCGAYSNVVNRKVSLKKPTVTLTAAKKKVTIKVPSVPGEDGYIIEYSLNSKKGFSEVANLDVYTKSYDQINLKSKKTYYYRVRVYRVINEKPVYSAWSDVKKVTVK